MSATNFNTRNDTYRKLIGNGLSYRVPRFQRDYSWGEDEWDDLWQDILGTVRDGGELAHYMGYLVLQSADDKVFDIIDGQQRLTTLSLFVLAGLNNLQRLLRERRDIEATHTRLEQLRQTYIGYLDPVTLVSRSKLTLNRNNDGYYQSYLVPLAENLPKRGFKASEHNLRKAFEWFDRHIREHVRTESDPGMAIAQIVDRMSDKLFFTVITVTDELNAYKVFETLNARGVRLSATDLLKNYLFSVLHKDSSSVHGDDYELRVLDDRWEQIVGRLGAESFPDFLRVHWISRHSFVRQADLFKTISSKIVSRSNVFELLTNMEADMDAYLALTNPEGSDWTPEAKDSVRLLRMFSVRQPNALLMAAHRVLQPPAFVRLLKATVVVSFRYNVIGNQQTSEQERTYHAVAERIAKGELSNYEMILDGIRAVYPTDEAFKAAFAEKSINTKLPRNRQVVRYILCEIEKQKSGNAINRDDDSVTIEHICPTNAEDGWPQFSDRDVEEMSDRLGNMTLLRAGTNRALGNVSYESKRAAFEQSGFQITKEVALENTEWTTTRIENRQTAMARMATSIWRIPQFN